MTVLPGRASHRGGTLEVAIPSRSTPGSRDPAEFNGVSQWQMLSLTNDGLVTYRRVGGLAGAELVADLTTAIPQPTNDGLDLHVPASRGDSLFQWRHSRAGGHPARDRARV